MPMLEKMGYDDICPTCGSALIDGDQVTEETCIYCHDDQEPSEADQGLIPIPEGYAEQ